MNANLGTPPRPELAARLAELHARYRLVQETIVVAGQSYVMVHPRSADELLDEDAFNRDGRIPYWAEVWISSRVLAELIEPPGRPGLRWLELGCGAGLAVLAALRAGYAATATDYYPEALDFVALNAELNGLPRPVCRMVDWRDYPADLRDFDWVMAADVLYEKEYPALVAATLARSLAADGRALVVDPQRVHAVRFIDELAACGLTGEKSHFEGQHADGRRQTVDVYRIARG